jgi:hypothetical protein
MKIEINTSGKAVECANCILGQAIASILGNKEIQKSLNLSDTGIKNAASFRKALLKGYLKQSTKP